jgi:hypothetical protein
MGLAEMNDPPRISIATNLRRLPKVVELTLLHEMAHLSSDDFGHKPGGGWHREMRRLARAGAFDNLW